jgi:hypothetical protein
VYIPESNTGINGIKTDNPNEYGIKLEKDTINEFFKHFDIPLSEKYVSIFQYEDWSFDDAISDFLKTDNHIVCGFSYSLLYNEKANIDVGHVSIITAKNYSEIELLDPGPKNPGIKHIDSENLYSAIKRKRDGLWLISSV